MADTIDAARGRWTGRGQGFLDGTETLRLTVWNGAPTLTVRLSGRVRGTDGRIVPFVETLIPTTDRVATTLDRSMPEGELLGVSARVSVGTSRDGWTYATIELGTGTGTGFQALDVLAADCITATRRVGWPGSGLRGPIDSGGFMRSISGTTPAAGAEIAESVPTGARWEVVAFGANLVTSATVANRQPALVLDDGANVFFRGPMNVNEVASGTFPNYWSQGLLVSTGAPNNVVNGSLPINNRLGAGSRIRTITTAIQAGDQWGSVQYLVREWIEGA
jgi:hypothetical protein